MTIRSKYVHNATLYLIVFDDFGAAGNLRLRTPKSSKMKRCKAVIDPVIIQRRNRALEVPGSEHNTALNAVNIKRILVTISYFHFAKLSRFYFHEDKISDGVFIRNNDRISLSRLIPLARLEPGKRFFGAKN